MLSAAAAWLPPDKLMGGLAARGGYRWKWFGIEGGPMAFQGWDNNTDTSPTVAFFPDVALRTGPQDQWEVAGGVGAPNVTTARRPGLYLAGDVAVNGGHRVGVSGGVFRQGPALTDEGGPRFDAFWRSPVTKSLYLRAGGSVSVQDNGSGGEVSLGLGTRL